MVTAGAVPAWSITFTTDVTINAGDATHDGQDIVVSGCTVTINGAHTFTSLLVTNYGIKYGHVTHTANTTTQEYWMDLTVTGDLTVDPGSSISADGKGYGPGEGPGGGGVGGVASQFGGGAGYGGHGSPGNNPGATGGDTYGSAIAPADLGSGGGDPAAGGAGGGAIRLQVAGTLYLHGTISANGEQGKWIDSGPHRGGGGSGGSIYIQTGTLAGEGVISADAGNGVDGEAGGGGGGRIAISCGACTGNMPWRVHAWGGSGMFPGEGGSVIVEPDLIPGYVLYVNAGAQGANDGTSWTDAYTSLQSALTAAVSGDEIWVAAGTYKPAGPGGDRNATFQLKSGVGVYGGFAGSETRRTQRNCRSHLTVLSGDLNGDDGLHFENYGDNAYHVATAINVGLSAVLDGFVLTAGYANAENHGAGLYVVNGSPQLTNCTLRANRASQSGGGPGRASGGAGCVHGGCPMFTNCTIAGNKAEINGGGFQIVYGSASFYNCTFMSNSAAAQGGALQLSGLATAVNCTFVGNTAAGEGGAVVNVGRLDLGNCTFLGNYNTWYGGSGGAALHSHGSGARVAVERCVFYDNVDPTGMRENAQILNTGGSIMTVERSYVQAWTGGLGGSDNFDVQPYVTPDGHLLPDSPCIDAGGAGAGGAAEQMDRDPGDVRPWGSAVDLGSDEFIDSNSDGLPDWWTVVYSGATGPTMDTDGDGLTNLQEYSDYSSNPLAAPFWVDASEGNDTYDGKAPVHPADPPGNTIGPKRTIQAALSLVSNGDTVLVAPGLYQGTGNSELDYGGKSAVVRAGGGPAPTTIDCSGSGQAVKLDSIRGTFAVLEGFTIQNGQSDLGGGFRTELSRGMLKNCRLVGNAAMVDGGALYSRMASPVIDGVIIQANGAPTGKAEAGVITNSSVDLLGTLEVQAGRLDLLASWLDGPGELSIGQNAVLRITGEAPNAPATVFRSRLSAAGQIVIDPGQQLIVERQGIIDLNNEGQLSIDGRLLLRDSAALRNAAVTIRQAEISTLSPVQYNDIHLLDSMNSGGEFFVQDDAQVLNNVITSEGDRYLDFDPDAAAIAHPLINNNTLRVGIMTSPDVARGTLLELRARDADCGTGGTGINPNCTSGAFQTIIADRFESDPAQNWVLESLEIKPGAKLNLTNRPGFQFQTDTTHPETVYVKTLKLYPGATLNTALQTLYYEQLVDENGQVIDPPSLPDGTGRKIVDVPLLGFSLGIIGMNDQTPSPFNEFDIRVRQRPKDPADPNPAPPAEPVYIGSITRLPDARDPANHDGVMEMKTRAAGEQSASSVAAKGVFARAGEENIVVAFEYQFINDGDAHDGEIVVKLSDNQEVGESNYEVARVRPPVSGLPGAVGSSEYAVFYQVVPYEDWSAHLTKLVRGTYVELELRGKGAVVRIDNFDPQVICRFECASYDGAQGVTEADYLVLLSQYGRALTSLNPTVEPLSCLDSRLSRDLRVDLADLLAWDALMSGSLNSCSYGLPSAAPEPPPIKPAGSAVLPSGGLVVTGKPRGTDPVTHNSNQKDVLYTLTTTGACSASGVLPAEGTRGNGRLILDRQGRVYQLHAMMGLVCLEGPPENRQTVVPSRNDLTCEGKTVYVGVVKDNPNCTQSCVFTGLPLNDAVFHPTDDTAVYVVPVLVRVLSDGHTYRAAAKLRLSTNEAGQYTGQYSVERLYGMNPYTDPMVLPNTPETSPYDIQRLREIEISRDGSRVLVSSSQALNGNDWLLIYNESTGEESRIELDALSTPVQSPISMLASSREDKVYMGTSAASSGNTRLFRLNLSGSTVTLDGWIDLTVMRQVTSIVENRANGSLYAVGLTFDAAAPLATFTNTDPIFTQAKWATIAPVAVNWTGGQTIPSQAISGSSDLALPLSAVFAGHALDFDNDGDVDHDDVDIFETCASGPGIPRPSGCEGKDLDNDNDVDQADFSILQRSLTGAQAP